ncbi:VanW family protein [Fuchsiella alkaliacetigena]|uniref:VanW family protein n=1 Tax=Fuchsiella alkaliacetigena TaxID=957042 RepID=UPI002009F027|nr:VanW family protein [Fuchsiella alkaliacetigena]MCK8826008.1 VanW family protein [Fuchsiella alkaliacetigena]
MKRIALALVIILTTLLLAGIGVTIGAQFFFNEHQDVFFSGVMIEGYNLGGLKQEEVLELLDEITERVLKEDIILEAEKQKWKLSPEEIELDYKKQEAVDAAFAIGREGNIWKRGLQIWKVAEQGLNFKLKIEYNEEKLKNKLREINDQVNIEAQDAYLDLETQEIVSSRSGQKLDVEDSKQKIVNRLARLETLPIRLIVIDQKPRVKAEEIEELGLTEVLSTYTTEFDSSKENRVQNISLASDKINGVFLEAGETFSFNEIVGPRTRQRGYQEAIEIVNREFVTGIGGGICQVTSTLYNSVLLANLEVISRTNHSRPVGYVDLGRGATVYYGLLDFKFKNTSSQPIMILTKMTADELTVKLMGRADNEQEIKITTTEAEVLPYQQVEKINSNLSPGQENVKREGRTGYRVKVKRKILVNKEVVKEELVSEDTYQPIDKVVEVPVN